MGRDMYRRSLDLVALADWVLSESRRSLRRVRGTPIGLLLLLVKLV